MQRSPELDLWPRVLASYSGHHPGTGLRVNNVSHGLSLLSRVESIDI